MKTSRLEDTTLDDCVRDAQCGQVIVTRGGHPVALVLGVEGLDELQVESGTSAEFWRQIRERRNGRSIDRTELERMLDPESTEKSEGS